MKPTKTLNWRDHLSFIPSSITLCNALCGLSAIIYMTGSRGGEGLVPLPAVWLILAAMFFDIFDGFAARKLNAVSRHGMELDSLSDLLSFGIAPAILIFRVAQGCCDGSVPGQWVAWAAAGFFMVCAMWRLALYNTVALSDTSSDGVFSGLPTPGATAILCSMALLSTRLNVEDRAVGFIIIAYGFILGLMMISGFKYNHFKKVVTTGPIPFRIAVFLLMLTAILMIDEFIFYLLFVVVHLYLLSGLMGETHFKKDLPLADTPPEL
ncbi:hypothetical protein PDESU_06477 [Pontiella desulfatans]|uniref:CDP-diacylglycerol--serine O-phosphatidyltransferase n=1 Tax=Pontiella desulfatans TaxID=2750659 RepID=A0A6C2UCN8_PONDE|nr:CDP-alcohol phosphatidyltransferase family protein [Pontiella desulfatans]VGO17875.1 hypothetical protein PDESU_06477 [Pontiella desulfatans]